MMDGSNDRKFACKRVTVNFMHWREFTSEADEADFKKWHAEIDNGNDAYIYDKRNGIYCVNPTCDFEMYYNYLVYINAHRDEWTRQGYFDAGLVPYIMLPDIAVSDRVRQDAGLMGVRNSIDNLAKMMRDWAQRCGVNLIQLSGISFLKSGYVSSFGGDYWLFRDDLVALAHYVASILPEAESLKQLNEDNVSMSSFVKIMSDIYNAERARRNL